MAEPTEPAALVPSVVVLAPVVAALAVALSGADRVIRNPVALSLRDTGFRSELASDQSVMVAADTSTIFPELQNVESALTGLAQQTTPRTSTSNGKVSA